MTFKRIHNFKNFINEVNGYGNEPFYFERDGDSWRYFFKIADGDERRGIVLDIGKFTKFTQPDSAKNSYAVLDATEMSEADLDQAVLDEGSFESNNKIINLDKDTAKAFFDILTKCVLHYLQDNPKVSRFYDELQGKVSIDNYNDYIKSSIGDWPGGSDVWKFQEVEKNKLNIISK